MVQLGIDQGYQIVRTKYFLNGDSLISITNFSIPTREEFLARNSDTKNIDAAAVLLFERREMEKKGVGIIASYTRHEYLEMNAGMLLYMADLDFQLAKVLNLGWEDNLDTVNVRTKYAISLNGSALSTFIFSDSNRCRNSKKPIKQFFAIPGDRSIALTWDIYYDQSGYIGFYIERSKDSKTWTRLNELPIAIVDQGDANRQHWITYSDTVRENGRSYYYRLQGITSFGQYGPYSKILNVKASPPLDIHRPYLLEARNVGDTSLYLHWRISGIDSALVDQIEVMRAPHPDSPFVAVVTLDGLERTYLDDPGFYNNYYLIKAKDSDGRVYTGSIGHGQLPDKIPPLTPSGVIATVDTIGKVSIRWSANMEKDLSGYRVFYKRYLPDEEIQLTTASIRDNWFTHSVNLKMLNRHIYYQISAEDEAGNRSSLSAPVKVLLPDTIAPSSPVLLNTESSTSDCIVEYTLSGSTDVRCHILLRKMASDEFWLLIDTIYTSVAGKHTSVDSLLDPGQNASYQLTAIDSSGNSTKSNILTGRRIDSKIRVAPFDAMYTWRKKNRELKFEWSYVAEKDIQAFRIYRQDRRNGKYLTYKYLRIEDVMERPDRQEASRFSFVLSPIEETNLTDYKMRIDFKDGAISRTAHFTRRKK